MILCAALQTLHLPFYFEGAAQASSSSDAQERPGERRGHGSRRAALQTSGMYSSDASVRSRGSSINIHPTLRWSSAAPATVTSSLFTHASRCRVKSCRPQNPGQALLTASESPSHIPFVSSHREGRRRESPWQPQPSRFQVTAAAGQGGGETEVRSRRTGRGQRSNRQAGGR